MTLGRSLAALATGDSKILSASRAAFFEPVVQNSVQELYPNCVPSTWGPVAQHFSTKEAAT